MKGNVYLHSVNDSLNPPQRGTLRGARKWIGLHYNIEAVINLPFRAKLFHSNDNHDIPWHTAVFFQFYSLIATSCRFFLHPWVNTQGYQYFAPTALIRTKQPCLSGRIYKGDSLEKAGYKQ